MILSEVALGKMYERLQAETGLLKAPAGYHSTKGCGRVQPDASKSITLDNGCVVPLGTTQATSGSGYRLEYNEFIVYDVSQVRMKYLIKLDFAH